MPIRLFEKFGVELEYMIVRASDGRVAPVADEVMIACCGEPANDCLIGGCEISNELAAHVIEIKTPEPTADFAGIESDFVNAIRDINRILAAHDCCLLPGPMHPTMDPAKESSTWPHGCRDIYRTYDRIFDCRGHGWLNLQSCHLNLPFHGDSEFALLHSAIVLVLPLIPALSAGSPFRDGRATGLLDTRIETYRLNQIRCPLITGEIVPEAVFSEQEYREKILLPMFEQIRPLDPEGTLQHEWLNSRGAIARFDRSAIEIRLLDVQECPGADLALARLIIESLRHLVEIEGHRVRGWALASTAAARRQQLLEVVRSGLSAPLLLEETRETFGLPAACRTAGDFWRMVFERLPESAFLPSQAETIEAILTSGNLATRLLRHFRANESKWRPTLHALGDCLSNNRMLGLTKDSGPSLAVERKSDKEKERGREKPALNSTVFND